MPICDCNKTLLLNRVKRLEGQLRGIRKMIEEDRDCVDVLRQIAAATGAGKSLGMVMLEDHMKTCVVDAFESGNEGRKTQRVDEVVDLIRKFSR
ncbi:MAG: metal-sensitive transcriptional regulator [Phycisphaerales bacterium]|jgi:CsoR family transcriptional regulator, copper-sensing transcriptional repressor|nr:metal-sensitive transcriptional regulator [Phycisphaerales bacterium]MBT7171269.1 metal-sensitive transcriptional regulator [Phycisphaerales bacterium]